MTSEISIESAAPPPSMRGRHGKQRKEAIRLAVEGLQPGQVIRWRPLKAPSKSKANELCCLVKRQYQERQFTVRKEDGGFDIYRTA